MPTFLQHNNRGVLQDIASKLSQFDDAYPFLMFPVRIETRFMHIEYPTTVTWTYSSNVAVSLAALTNALDGINPIMQDAGPSDAAGRAFVSETFDGLINNVFARFASITELVASEKYKLEVESGFLRSRMELYLEQGQTEHAAILKQLEELSSSANGAQTRLNDLSNLLESAAGEGEETLPEGTWAKFSTHLQGFLQQIQAFNEEEDASFEKRLRQAAEIAVQAAKSEAYISQLTSLKEEDLSAANSGLSSLINEYSAFTESLGGVEEGANSLSGEYNAVLDDMQGYLTSLDTAVDGFDEFLIEAGPGHIPDEIAPGHIPNDEPADEIPPIAHELWVRVYPDDIMVDTHEAELTQDEIDHGEDYWEAIWAYPNDQELLETEWNKLASKHLPPRAAYIVKSIEPTNISSRPSGTPAFPTITPTTNTLGTAANSDVMPDRFVVVAFDSMNSKLEWAGNQITDDPLICGIDPSATSMYTWDLNGDLEVDPNIKWMFDFEEAYTKGLGIKVPLENGFDEDGYKRLYVLGLRIDEGGPSKTGVTHAADGKADLEALIDSHHYSLDGMSLVPQGTPTNNTEGSVAGSKVEEFDQRKLTSFEVEASDPLFSVETDVKLKSDGQWLAEALGIEPEKLEHIRHANGLDIRNAVMMNCALWPATAGTFLEHLLSDLFLDTDMRKINKLRDFFEDNVSGRGFIPSIRVGNQPYGILATTAYSDWEQDTAWSGYEKQWHDDYQAYVTEFENNYWNRWLEDNEIAHIHKVPTGANSLEILQNSQANFLNILGLTPTSISFFLRHGISTGATGHVLTLLADIDPNINTFQAGSNLQGIMDLFYYLRTNYPQLSTESPIIETVFLDEHLNLNGPLVDLYKPADTRTLRLVNGKNYIQHLLDSSIMRIRGNNLPAGVGDNSLLYLFLRRAYLQQYLDTSASLLDDLVMLDSNPTVALASYTLIADNPASNDHALVSLELEGGSLSNYPVGSIIRLIGGSDTENNGYFGIRAASENGKRNVLLTIQNPDAVSTDSADALSVAITADYGYGTAARRDIRQYARHDYSTHGVTAGQSQVSPWALMGQPVTGWSNFPSVSMEPGVYLHHYLDSSNYAVQTRYMRHVKDAMNILKTLTTADLERAFAEHLDLCTYRLDAWKQGVVNKRLRQNRAAQSQGGIYLGAFAWVENLKPAALEAVPNEELPPGYNSASKLKRDPKNQGYIHAPSIAHATASAVLRSGYNAFATNQTNEENIMAVNLSSERVRKALYFMEGIRNGQGMESLLGYQFERGLRDLNAVYNNHINTLRSKFSLVIDPQEVTNGIENAEANVVINGLELLKAADSPGYPYGLGGSLPTLGSTEANNIIAHVDKMKDAMDAVADLAISDSVYSNILSDFDQSAAMMDFLTLGKRPPEADIQKVNHKGKTLSQKAGILFTPITTYSGTARASSEPSFNAWLSDLLGDTADMRVLAYLDGALTPTEYALSDFTLDAIDFLYLLREESRGDAGALTKFLAREIRVMETGMDDTKSVKIAYMERDNAWNISVLSFGELIPFMDNLYDLLENSQPLNRQHMELPPTTIVDPVPTNPRGYDTTELRTRLTNAFDLASGGLKDLDADLTSAKTSLESTLSDANCLAVIAELLRAFEYGIPQAVPPTSKTGSFTIEEQDALLETANNVLLEVAHRVLRVDPLIAQIDSGLLAVHVKVDRMMEAFKIIFGGAFKVIPHFSLANHADYNTAIDVLYPTSGATFLPPAQLDPVGDWLHGMGKVRERMRTFESAALLADNFDMPRASGVNWKFSLTPFQLYPAGQNGISMDSDGNANSNEYWLATEFPEAYDVAHDSLLITLHYAGSGLTTPSDFASGNQCGIVVDEWTEQIPNKKVTTGVSFHYDHPDSKAPQSMLLCVSPTNNGQWNWNKMVSIMDNTFDNAKKRAVEPDHYKDTGLETLLPALVADLSTKSANLPQDFAENIEYPFYVFTWDDPNGIVDHFEAARDSNGNLI